MSARYQSEELWSLIIPHLRNPIPLPLSRPARSELRQPDLCAIIRTCKLFRILGEPHLYQHVVTDNLYHLFRYITPDAMTSDSALYQARKRQLAHTKSLTIEYLAKGQDPPAIYEELFNLDDAKRAEMGDKAWSRIGWSEELRRMWRLVECHLEVERFVELFKEVSQTSLPSILPLLESVSVGSVYGFQPETWKELHFEHHNFRDDQGRVAAPPLTLLCGKYFHKFLRTGNLRAICVRDTYGPFVVPDTSDMGDDNGNPPQNTIVHFVTDMVNLSSNSPVRWMFDGTPKHDWAWLINGIGQRLLKIHTSRSPTGASPSLDILISCSTSRYSPFGPFNPNSALLGPPPPYPPISPCATILSPLGQRDWARALQVEADGITIRDNATWTSLYPQDRVVWECAADSDPCQACGSRCQV